MASIRQRIFGIFDREPVKPKTEQGVGGFAVYGGYLNPDSYNPKMYGAMRWKVAGDILRDLSLTAACIRFMSNLISRPEWTWEPADDSPAAQEAAEFMQDICDDLDTSWTRLVRRSIMFKFHGFMAQEWIAKKRDDGLIGLRAIEQRPQHTITKWDLDEGGSIKGLIQTSPQTGEELYLPRGKLLYLVDDTLTDRPDGMGWFHHLVDIGDRLKSLLDLEAIGFERDLRGIPVGRAPFQEINRMISEGKLTKQQGDDMIAGLREFVTMQRRTSETGLVVDSKPYESKSENGITVSGSPQWDLQLISGDPQSVEEIGMAVKRLQYEVALLLGAEVLLTGREGEGSRALSEDKSRNTYLTANAILADIAEGVNRDIRDPIWAMNGFPDELKPKAVPEDVSFKDAETVAKTLADMATAGAVLAPDDDAIDDVRNLLGISPSKPIDPKMMAAMQGQPDPEADPDDGNDPEGGDDPKGKEADQKAADQAARKAAGRTLYVRRNLTPESAAAFVKWAKAQGFETTTPPEELHATIAFSRDLVDWDAMGTAPDSLTAKGGARSVVPLGDKGAVVLKFESDELQERWQAMRDEGASWDFEGYQPHVTITYNGTDTDLSEVEPYTGPLEFGAEIFEEVVDDWEKNLVEKYDPNQPRDPAGTSTGGQWTSTGAGGDGEEGEADPRQVLFEVAPNPDNEELKERWNSLTDEEKLAITQGISEKYTPEVLESLGIKGELQATIGGFEGEINPSLALTVDGDPFLAAGALGDVYGQKAMVVMSAEPAAGLDPVGMVAIEAPDADFGALRDMQGDLGDLAEGWTYRNGRLEVLNFTGKADADLARDIDERLGNAYNVKHATVYSSYIEASDYARPESDSKGNAWGQASGRLRESIAREIESRFVEVGKAVGEAGQAVLKGLVARFFKFNPDQPRVPAGQAGGGRWTDGTNSAVDQVEGTGEVKEFDAATREELTEALADKDLDELLEMAEANQKLLGELGPQLESDGVEFKFPSAKKRERIIEKVENEGYDGPHQILDMSRGTLVVDSVAATDQAIASLGTIGTVYDKGWKKDPQTLYMDRKTYVRTANGGLIEMQIVPRGMQEFKSGGGHKLYQIIRSPKSTPAQIEAALKTSRQMYGKSIEGTDFEQLGG